MPDSSTKTVLITGCSSGFGLLTAARLAAAGHTVYATMRNLSKQDALRKEVQRRQTETRVLELDVTKPETIRAAVEAAIEQSGRIDVLVNNAGYACGGFFEDLNSEEIHALMETNFFGVQNVIREVLPHMRRQKGGRIINISSIAGLYALPGFGAYNASKWALEGFSESLYYELKPFGIHVSLIEPGSYRTKIFYENRRYASRFADPQSPYRARSRYLEELVISDVDSNTKDPEDIARLVERLINSSRPPFRNIPDLRSKILSLLHRFLPFRAYSFLLYRLLFSRFKEEMETKGSLD